MQSLCLIHSVLPAVGSSYPVEADRTAGGGDVLDGLVLHLTGAFPARNGGAKTHIVSLQYLGEDYHVNECSSFLLTVFELIVHSLSTSVHGCLALNISGAFDM